jgi:hypothetical protein
MRSDAAWSQQASQDLDGKIVSYAWTQTAGTPVC